MGDYGYTEMYTAFFNSVLMKKKKEKSDVSKVINKEPKKKSSHFGRSLLLIRGRVCFEFPEYYRKKCY